MAPKTERTSKAAATKKASEPVKPKRACTAFGYFLADQLKKTPKGNATPQDRLKRLSEQWHKMSDDEKAPFEKKAKLDKERYQHLMEANNSKTKAKKPVSAYNLFIKDYMKTKKQPGVSAAEAMKAASEQWNTMSDHRKAPYIAEAKKMAVNGKKTAVGSKKVAVSSKMKKPAVSVKSKASTLKKKKTSSKTASKDPKTKSLAKLKGQVKAGVKPKSVKGKKTK